jgi:hypothetical protein
MLIALDDLPEPVALRRCDALLPALTAILGSWRFRIVDASGEMDERAAAILVRRVAGSYRISSPWLDQPVVEGTEVGAVFSLAAELACAFAEARPDHLCFHCAAVEIDGHLIVFPNSESAGKSTLATRLSAHGFRLFADDVLPISESGREGISLGIAPRLRRPLPSRAGSALRTFVAQHRGPGDNEYLYLALPAPCLAPHGETAPLGATIFLDRRQAAAAKLTPLARGHALHQLIIQNFAPGGTSFPTVERLSALSKRTACFTLTYSDLDEAAELLSDRFSAAHAPWRQHAVDPLPDEMHQDIVVEVASGSVGRRATRYRQRPGVSLCSVDNDIFLVKPGEDAVFHLNAVAASLWHLLEQPTTRAAAIAAVGQAFPGADVRRVRRDVGVMLNALQKGGLIQAASH